MWGTRLFPVSRVPSVGRSRFVVSHISESRCDAPGDTEGSCFPTHALEKRAWMGHGSWLAGLASYSLFPIRRTPTSQNRHVGQPASAYDFSGGRRDVRENSGRRAGLRGNGGWADGGSCFDGSSDRALNIGANQGISIRRDLDQAESIAAMAECSARGDSRGVSQNSHTDVGSADDGLSSAGRRRGVLLA